MPASIAASAKPSNCVVGTFASSDSPNYHHAIPCLLNEVLGGGESQSVDPQIKASHLGFPIRCSMFSVQCSASSGCGHRPLRLLPVHTLQPPRHLRTYYSTGCSAASLSWRFPSQSEAIRSPAHVVLRPQFIRNPDHDMISNMLATIPIGRIYNTVAIVQSACLA
jgi:hypothetical protein